MRLPVTVYRPLDRVAAVVKPEASGTSLKVVLVPPEPATPPSSATPPEPPSEFPPPAELAPPELAPPELALAPPELALAPPELALAPPELALAPPELALTPPAPVPEPPVLAVALFEAPSSPQPTASSAAVSTKAPRPSTVRPESCTCGL
jgi:hypothetical protein